MPNDVLNMLMNYEFPGNVRELENIIEHAFVLCRSPQIEIEHLPKEFIQKVNEDKISNKQSAGRLKEAENELIIDALKRHGGNRSKVADDLGINKSTLWRKMKKYNIK